MAAVHYILGERFDEDPFLIFRLRGRTEEQLTRALRAQRGQEGQERSEEDPDPEPAAPPLEEEIDSFWEAKPGFDTVKVSIKPSVVDLSVLRRLGQPGFVSEDLERLLAPSYEDISRAALRMGQGEEEDIETDVDTPDNVQSLGKNA